MTIFKSAALIFFCLFQLPVAHALLIDSFATSQPQLSVSTTGGVGNVATTVGTDILGQEREVDIAAIAFVQNPTPDLITSEVSGGALDFAYNQQSPAPLFEHRARMTITWDGNNATAPGVVDIPGFTPMELFASGELLRIGILETTLNTNFTVTLLDINQQSIIAAFTPSSTGAQIAALSINQDFSGANFNTFDFTQITALQLTIIPDFGTFGRTRLDFVDIAAVPEPASLLLISMGLFVLLRRRKQTHSSANSLVA